MWTYLSAPPSLTCYKYKGRCESWRQSIMLPQAVSGSMVVVMVLSGLFMRYTSPDGVPTLQQGIFLCGGNTTTPKHILLPVGLEEAALSCSTLLPLVPILINSYHSWNDGKTVAISSHLIGQGASFGLTEMLRFAVVSPSPHFLHHCNLTQEECTTAATEPLNTTHVPLCPQPNKPDLRDEVHHSPSHTLAMLGASLISLAFSIAFWPYLNKKGKAPSQASPGVEMYLILAAVGLLFITFVYIILVVPDQQSLGQVLISLTCGALLQVFASILAYLQPSSIQQQQQTQPSTQDSIV